MATHSSVLAWRIPGMAEPGGLPSIGSHRVRHNWSDLAAAAAVLNYNLIIWLHYRGPSYLYYSHNHPWFIKENRVRGQYFLKNIFLFTTFIPHEVNMDLKESFKKKNKQTTKKKTHRLVMWIYPSQGQVWDYFFKIRKSVLNTKTCTTIQILTFIFCVPFILILYTNTMFNPNAGFSCLVIKLYQEHSSGSHS